MSLNMSYYITEFDIGADLQQPHNFVKINGISPILHLPMEYGKQPNYRKLYQWINATELGLDESHFDSALTMRQFQNASTTTVIINSSSAKLTVEFLKHDLSVERVKSKRKQLKQKQLKRSLLILIKDQKIDKRFKTITKMVRICNLKNGSGELWIHFLFRLIVRK